MASSISIIVEKVGGAMRAQNVTIFTKFNMLKFQGGLSLNLKHGSYIIYATMQAVV